MEQCNDLLNIDKFKNYINDKNIQQLAIKYFWKNFESYKKEQPDEFEIYFKNFNMENLFIEVTSISVKFGNWPDCSYNHIVADIPIWYKSKNIGQYKSLFTFEGEIDDDFFIIY